MLSARQLLAAAGAIFTIAACERTITGPTVYVDRPVPGPRSYDTVVVVRPETTFTQLPGRVDTVVALRTDTLVIVRHDTTMVVRTDTVIVVHTDTIRLDHSPAFICFRWLSKDGDSLYLPRVSAIGPCGPDAMAAQFPSVKVVVLFDSLKIQLQPAALSTRVPKSALILPGWAAGHP